MKSGKIITIAVVFLAVSLAAGLSCGGGKKSPSFKAGVFTGVFIADGRSIDVFCALTDNGSAEGVVQVAGSITARKRIFLGGPLTFFNATDLENST